MAKVDPEATTPELRQQEMLEILKQIARDGGNAAARIAAIRVLREIGDTGKPAGAFAELDELAPRRNMRVKKRAG